MSVIVMVMTDGRRECMEPTMESLRARIHGPIDRYVIHDDSGDPGYLTWLHETYPDCLLIGPRHRSGFCAAYGNAWRWLSGLDSLDAPWVFQTEDDFTFETHIDLQDLIDVLTRDPLILQMQLRRQPWWTEPVGGFIAQWPDLYTDASDGVHHWLEHRRNWSTNPGLFHRELCRRTWPPPPGCEKTLGDELMADYPNSVFAVWGTRGDPHRVRHIGLERIGHSY